MSLRKYLVIKYILSIVALVISLINYSNIFISIMIFILVYTFPNVICYLFKKEEKLLLINEIKSLVNDIIVCISASNSLYNALKYASSNIEYKRLKQEFILFIKAYEFYGYSIKKSINVLRNKFDMYEMTMFLNTLSESERNGNLLENMEKLSRVLDISYMKYIKRESSKKLLYVTLGTVSSLVNIIAIVTYPIFMQVADNLQTIFK